MQNTHINQSTWNYHLQLQLPFHNWNTIASGTRYKTIKEERTKTLLLEQMHQILLIVHAKVKVANT